jgi:predicted GNAT family acetyltransferase
MADTTVTVHEALESNRFEAVTDSDTVAGFARYRLEPDGSYRLLHTEVADAYEGQGVGSKLAERVMSSLREQDRRIHPDCPFIASYMKRHPETHDLLAEGVELSA